MEQLLNIRTIPARYECKIQKAVFEYTGKRSSLEYEREDGGLRMKRVPARLDISTFEARNSVVPTIKTAIRDAALKGLQTAGEAASRYAREMNQMVWTKPGEDMIGSIAASRTGLPTGDFMLAFLPSERAKFTYHPGSLEMEYQAERLKFEARVQPGSVHYTPGSVKMEMVQRPEVRISYTRNGNGAAEQKRLDIRI